MFPPPRVGAVHPGLPLTEQAGVKEHLPADKEFEGTFHHDMCLDLPDRERLVNLKKVYYLCMLSPELTPLLVWLTRFRIPLLFDVLFVAHFAYYVFVFERTSFRQFLHHVRIFGINPILRRRRLLQKIVEPLSTLWRRAATGWSRKGRKGTSLLMPRRKGFGTVLRP